MSVAAELTVNRKQTLAFIADRPSTIILVPKVRTKTDSGGFLDSEGTPRIGQTLRLIEQQSAYGNNPGKLPAQDAITRRTQLQLLGPWYAEMEVGDHWVVDGKRYEVDELLPYNGYERRAVVKLYG